MTNFFDEIPFAAAEQIERLSRLLYELRENRKRLLEPYGVTDEDALLALITDRRIDEHPAYEHYLSANILTESHAAVRAELQLVLAAANAS
ncbi:MAG: hypothetical protein ACM3SV_13635 [Betaproteobacteria bacterium]